MSTLQVDTPILPGVTHCRCSPPRYVRCVDGQWRRIWVVPGGRERYVDIGKREPNCRGCWMRVAPEPV